MDSVGAFSSIPPRVLLKKDIRSYIHCKIGKIGDFDMYVAFQALFDKEIKLKLENKIVETLGLTNALNFPKNFKNELIRVVLSHFHDGIFWLENLIQVKKRMISRVTGYPTTNKVKAFRSTARAEIEKNTSASWDGRALKIASIVDPEVKFMEHVIGYKIF